MTVSIEDYEALIYFVENKISNTKDFYERKELKEKLTQINKDKEEFMLEQNKTIEDEDKKLSDIVKTKNDFSESENEVFNKINEYI